MAKVAATELEVAGHTVRVSNPDKIYFPERGFTKLDVVQYYLNVGDGILRALRERPTTLERWPGGVIPGAKLSTRMDHSGRRVLSEAPAHQGRAGVDRERRDQVPEHAYGRGAVPGRPRARGLGGAARHDRVPPVAGAALRCGLSRRAAHRPGSPAGHRLRRRGRRWPARSRGCWTSWAGSASRRPPAVAGCTSTSGSLHSGRSPRCGGRRSRSAGRSSAAGPTRPPPSGGRRSGASGSSSTTTRWPATGPSPAPTRCGPAPTRPPPRRSPGTS